MSLCPFVATHHHQQPNTMSDFVTRTEFEAERRRIDALEVHTGTAAAARVPVETVGADGFIYRDGVKTDIYKGVPGYVPDPNAPQPHTPSVDPKYFAGATFRVGAGEIMTVDRPTNEAEAANGMVHAATLAREIAEQNPEHYGYFYANQVTWVKYADGSTSPDGK